MAEKRIILFGKTGSGKSTVGNMLTNRTPRYDGGFAIGDGFRGVTAQIGIKRGHNWAVVDTIGMGETKKGTVSNEDAKRILCEYLKQIRYEYSFIVYVASQGRMDEYQAVIWLTFKEIFKGGEDNFVVLFTNSSEKWIQENKIQISEEFTGCSRFIAVDFPPVVENELSEMLNKERRSLSLKYLEMQLENYSLSPIAPKISTLSDQEVEPYVNNFLGKIVSFGISILRSFAVSEVVQYMFGIFAS